MRLDFIKQDMPERAICIIIVDIMTERNGQDDHENTIFPYFEKL